MVNESEIEFYIIRKRPHERDLVAAVCLKNGAFAYYIFLPSEPKENSTNLLKYLTNSNSHVTIKRIDNIENFIGYNNVSVNIQALDLKNFQTKIMCDRLSYSLKKFMEQESQNIPSNMES